MSFFSKPNPFAPANPSPLGRSNSTPNIATTATPFGSTTAATSTPFGSFGTTATTSASSTPTTPSVFGSSTTGTGTGAFGSTLGTTSFGTGGGGTSPFANTTGTNAFGAGTTPGTSTFGSSTFGSAPSTGASTLGTGTGSFGSTGSTFGKGINTFGSTNAFGSTNTLGSSTFGSLGATAAKPTTLTDSTAGAATTTAKPTPSLLSLSRQERPIEQQIQAIQNAYDPASPLNAFHFFFYNNLPLNSSPEQFMKPPLAREGEWTRARKNNPDEKKFVPALAVGWDDLKKRVVVQKQQSERLLGGVEELSKKLEVLSKHQTLELPPRLLKLDAQHQALTIRLLQLISRLAPLLPMPVKKSFSSLRSEPTNLLAELTEMNRVAEEEKKRVGAIWAAVGRWRAQVESGEMSRDGTVKDTWIVGNEEELNRILKVLDDQQKGLDHLIRILKRDEKDVVVVREAFGLQAPNPNADGSRP